MSILKDISIKSPNFSKVNDFKPLAHFDLKRQSLSRLSGVTVEESRWQTGKGVGGGVPLSGRVSGDGLKSIFADDTDNHTLIIGPTGTKKSRLIAMPTVRILSAAGESMIITDPKAEIYNRTGRYLQDCGYNVFIINLREPNHGYKWNPLAIPYQFYKNGDIDRACEFANDIAENLTKVGISTSEPFWDNSAGSLFFGLTMLLFKYCSEHEIPDDDVNIGNVIKLKNELFDCDDREMRKDKSPLWLYGKQDFIIASALSGTIAAPNETYGSIMSVFNEKMTLFQIRPSLLNMLSMDSGIFENVDNTPTAVFLILPDEKTAYHGLASLLIKQSYEYIIFKAQTRTGGLLDTTTNVRVNYILDEFSSLPTVNDFPAMITAARSRNIRFNIFVQSKHQLEIRYEKEAETIQANCGNWIFLSSRELKLLDELSRLCGPEHKDRPNVPQVSITLMQQLDKHQGEALVLSGRMKPHIAKLFDINDYDDLDGRLDREECRPTSSFAIENNSWHMLEFTVEEKYNWKIVKKQEMLAALERQSLENTGELSLSQMMQKKEEKPKFNVDELVARIDQKIAELDREEQYTRAKQSISDVSETNNQEAKQ